MYINARSLVKKIDLLETYVKENKIDIVFVTETWFNEDILDGEVHIDGFQCFRGDRKHKIGGGVAIYIHDNIKATKIDNYGTFTEQLWCKVYEDEEIKVGVIYKWPSISKDDESKLFASMKEIPINSRTIVTGDFNYPGINWDLLTATSPNAEHFMNIIQDKFLHQHVKKPTRKETLDLILSSDEEMVENLEVLEHFGNSDHNCICWKTIIRRGQENKCGQTYMDWNKANWESMEKELKGRQWEQELDGKTVEEMWKMLKHIYEKTSRNVCTKERTKI